MSAKLQKQITMHYYVHLKHHRLILDIDIGYWNFKILYNHVNFTSHNVYLTIFILLILKYITLS